MGFMTILMVITVLQQYLVQKMPSGRLCDQPWTMAEVPRVKTDLLARAFLMIINLDEWIAQFDFTKRPANMMALDPAQQVICPSGVKGIFI